MAEQYRGRINTAVDYIEKNLNHNFSLDEIATVAGFSKYHFHRIFYIFTGESLFQFIQRLRLEKAATLLLTDPVKPVTDIALESGFANSSSFAKSFKQHFNFSASQWRDLKSASCLQESNLEKKDSNQGQVLSNSGKDSFTENLLSMLIILKYGGMK